MIGLIGWLMAPVALAFSALLFVLWVWMLIHAISNSGVSDTEKLMWVVLVIFLPVLGAAIYFFIGRPKHRRGAV